MGNKQFQCLLGLILSQQVMHFAITIATIVIILLVLSSKYLVVLAITAKFIIIVTISNNLRQFDVTTMIFQSVIVAVFQLVVQLVLFGYIMINYMQIDILSSLSRFIIVKVDIKMWMGKTMLVNYNQFNQYCNMKLKKSYYSFSFINMSTLSHFVTHSIISCFKIGFVDIGFRMTNSIISMQVSANHFEVYLSYYINYLSINTVAIIIKFLVINANIIISAHYHCFPQCFYLQVFHLLIWEIEVFLT